MATYQGHIHAGKGYTSQKITVSGVVSQSAAKQLMAARWPGAMITAVQHISSKDD
jgi:hypothetical protein